MNTTHRRPDPPLTQFGGPAGESLAQMCARISAAADPPALVTLQAQIKRRFLGVLTRVSWGPTHIQGWRVRWTERGQDGQEKFVAYLVTPSGITYALRPGGGARAMYSNSTGFPPQPNPATREQAQRVEENLEALISGHSRRPSA